MSPIRRYLRITQHSVLECRIYLDNPADAHRWLLHPRSPALPRVIEAVRPLVLPKLREENARAKSGKGGGKRKGWKDVVVEAVFLTETSARHTILKKEKRAKVEKGRLGAANGRLTGTKEAPVEVGENAPGLVREESDDDPNVRLADIPAAGDKGADGGLQMPEEESREELFVSDESPNEDAQMANSGDNRKGSAVASGKSGGEEDDKKKLALDTTYDGFSIYGRILCLVVKRRGTAKGRDSVGVAGQAMMEEWIASTQMNEGQIMDE